MTDNTIPEGYMQNARGHLVPEDKVRDHDKLRDRVVRDFADEALALSEQLVSLKARVLKDMEDLVAICAERYGVELGGKRGNLTLTSYDGSLKLVRDYQEHVHLSEEVEVAKELIDKCFGKWESGPEVRQLVDLAFRRNGAGKLKTSALLDLMRLDYDDDDWQQAMEALKDALSVHSTSIYVRFYQRIGKTNQWRAIPLDLASIIVPDDAVKGAL